MKVLAIILLFFICSVLSIQEQELIEEWNNFQVKYGKTYRSPLEARKRLAIFNDNLEEIRAHNALFDEGKTTYRKGINKLADLTHEEIKQHYKSGLLNKPLTNSGGIFKKSNSVQLPDFVDWREKGAVSEVKNQGDCGACWAFSATGALESQLRIKQNLSLSLSEQNLVDCNKADEGCHGGWPSHALDYIKQNGIEIEEDYPYEEHNGVCRSDSSKVKAKVSGYETIPEGDEDALTQAVAEKGPVSICIFASDNFDLYESGILIDPECPPGDLNHAILVVGYGRENGIDYYIGKNSWGTSYGESGYLKMARNFNNLCGVASVAVIPVL
ncbi:hypothetical protein WA026_019656 [Henosepilachna vigintioctopunctata]|uniref:Uncharacterized protein n=1 Tax=Henosepilachna vigintioctopunctata TaxID=420089 RepID=A0AAW1TPW7_9CUCU